MYYHITHLPFIPPMPEDYNPWLTGIASYFDGVFNLDDCTREWAKGFSDKQKDDYGVNDILSDIGSISDQIYKYV